MKNRCSRLFAIAVMLLMTMALIGVLPITTFAANGDVVVNVEANLDFSESDLTLTGGVYTKAYDGTKTVTGIRVTDAPLGGVAGGDDVRLVVESAEFDSETIADATKVRIVLRLAGADAEKYTVSPIEIPARILPGTLYWAKDQAATAQTLYRPDATAYTSLKVENIPALVNAKGEVVEGVSVVTTTPYTVSVQEGAAGEYLTSVAVALDNPNYTVAPVPVKVTVLPVQITSIAWKNDYTFAYGDAEANRIKVFGYDADGNEYALAIAYPVGYGAVGSHVIHATSADPSAVFATDPAKTVVITKKALKVTFESATYTASLLGAENPRLYGLSVVGADGTALPADVLSQIIYTADGAPFVGASAHGVYNVVATLPDSANYTFVDAQGNEVKELKATLRLNKTYLADGVEGTTHQVILTNLDGIGSEASLDVTVPAELNRQAIRGFRVYKAYTVSINQIDGTYTITIPIEDALYAKNCKALTDRDLYLYDVATGTAVRVLESTGFKVSVQNGCYQIDGVTGAGVRTFILAPEYETPFLFTALGITLLVLMILVLLVLLFFIGLYLRRMTAEKNKPDAAHESETDKTPSPDAPIEPEQSIAHPEEKPEEKPDETLAETAQAEEGVKAADEAETPEATADVDLTPGAVDAEDADALEQSSICFAIDAIVKDAMRATMGLGEAVFADDAQITPDADVVASVAECVAQAFEKATVDGVTPSFKDGVSHTEITQAVDEAAAANAPSDWTEELGQEIRHAISEELIARLPAKEEEAVEVFAQQEETVVSEAVGEEVKEETPLSETTDETTIAFDDPAVLPAKEKDEEPAAVVRYRRSFQACMSQSEGNVQDYYNTLKNALLSYEGIKSRISWNYESFNRGRKQIAKIDVKGKTLYLYLALDPKELASVKKYGIVNVSSKKKYASVPVLMKIKGARKLKYSLEMIEKLCREQLSLAELKQFKKNYRFAKLSDEQLLEKGLIKRIEGDLPVVLRKNRSKNGEI